MFSKPGESAFLQGCPDLFRQIEIKMEVVDSDESEAKDFFRFHQMPDVSSRKRTTS
jgi:hypothetical protein